MNLKLACKHCGFNGVEQVNYYIMFNFLKKDPIKELSSKRKKLLEEAMHIQRSGDLKLYAIKMEAIDKLEKELDALQSAKS